MKKKILIVDDAYPNRYLLVQTLADYECMEAANGDEMWEVLKTRMPDLIIMDIGLPGEDGLRLAARLSNNPQFRHIPVVFLTAHSSKREIVEGMRAGGYDYLVKPVDDVLLLDRIKAVLDRKRREKFTALGDTSGKD